MTFQKCVMWGNTKNYEEKTINYIEHLIAKHMTHNVKKVDAKPLI